ncbi:MAG: rRNA pseudouridine synthase [Zetaproteobacteria bacterium]|nr:MAG: rRNA pseudouridine synthase [Zetaproteobacteria bacterium]
MGDARERLDRLLSRLGYGSRRDIARYVRQGKVEVAGGPARTGAMRVHPAEVRFDGTPLDHPDGLTVVYHKPVGSVCSHREQGRLIYEDFPPRWLRRRPVLASAGRLDKNTSGLLVLSDDGALNHRLTSPRHAVAKVYHARLARPLRGDEAERLASGRMVLAGEDKPCLPAGFRALGACAAEVTVYEGRYHLVRRLFAALGNHVVALQRIAIGGLRLDELDLVPGGWRVVAREWLWQRVNLHTRHHCHDADAADAGPSGAEG